MEELNFYVSCGCNLQIPLTEHGVEVMGTCLLGDRTRFGSLFGLLIVQDDPLHSASSTGLSNVASELYQFLL